MSQDSFDLFKSHDMSHLQRARMRWVELFIMVLFVVSLLIGFGVFMGASKAADARVLSIAGITLDPPSVIPGTMQSGFMAELGPPQRAGNASAMVASKAAQRTSGFGAMDDDDSCELKP